MVAMTDRAVAMISSQRPKECEVSCFRHGNDPPKQIYADSLSERKQPASPSTQFMIRLFQVQPSLFVLDTSKSKEGNRRP
jgi:hypothetical protein